MGYTAKQVIGELARFHGLLHDDGTINHSAFARRSGIPQPTVTRILNGPDDWQFSKRTADKLCRRFGLSKSQVLGHEPITKKQSKALSKRFLSMNLSPADLDLLRDWQELSPEQQADVREFVTFKRGK